MSGTHSASKPIDYNPLVACPSPDSSSSSSCVLSKGVEVYSSPHVLIPGAYSSRQIFVTDLRHISSSQVVVTDPRHISPSQVVVTDPRHRSSSLVFYGSPQIIVTDYRHTFSSQILVTNPRPWCSTALQTFLSQILVTDSRHRSSSQILATDPRPWCSKALQRFLSQILVTDPPHRSSPQILVPGVGICGSVQIFFLVLSIKSMDAIPPRHHVLPSRIATLCPSLPLPALICTALPMFSGASAS
ncbi:hypothetical protein BsWGS_24752 [Bradybaena similaris]